MSFFEWLDVGSLCDRILSWFYPNRGLSADFHERRHSHSGAFHPDTTAGSGAHAHAG